MALPAQGAVRGTSGASHGVSRRHLYTTSATQYMLIQESMNEYVDEEYGIACKGLFALVTVEDGGAFFDAYIDRGHCSNYKGVTVNADENSRAVYVENLREEDEN